MSGEAIQSGRQCLQLELIKRHLLFVANLNIIHHQVSSCQILFDFILIPFNYLLVRCLKAWEGRWGEGTLTYLNK